MYYCIKHHIITNKIVHDYTDPEEGTVHIGSYIYNDNACELEYILFSEGNYVVERNSVLQRNNY